MTVSKIATSAVLALSLVGATTAAQAAPMAGKLSVARAGATTAKKNELAGGGLIIAIIAAAAVIAGIVIAADNDDDSPTSA